MSWGAALHFGSLHREQSFQHVFSSGNNSVYTFQICSLQTHLSTNPNCFVPTSTADDFIFHFDIGLSNQPLLFHSYSMLPHHLLTADSYRNKKWFITWHLTQRLQYMENTIKIFQVSHSDCSDQSNCNLSHIEKLPQISSWISCSPGMSCFKPDLITASLALCTPLPLRQIGYLNQLHLAKIARNGLNF